MGRACDGRSVENWIKRRSTLHKQHQSALHRTSYIVSCAHSNTQMCAAHDQFTRDEKS